MSKSILTFLGLKVLWLWDCCKPTPRKVCAKNWLLLRLFQQALHKHCHHDKTKEDQQTLGVKTGTYDKNCITEERSESKDSCSVLQTSRMGDCPA